MNQVCYRRLEGVEGSIKEAIVKAILGHFDETGVRIGAWCGSAPARDDISLLALEIRE